MSGNRKEFNAGPRGTNEGKKIDLEQVIGDVSSRVVSSILLNLFPNDEMSLEYKAELGVSGYLIRYVTGEAVKYLSEFKLNPIDYLDESVIKECVNRVEFLIVQALYLKVKLKYNIDDVCKFILKVAGGLKPGILPNPHLVRQLMLVTYAGTLPAQMPDEVTQNIVDGIDELRAADSLKYAGGTDSDGGIPEREQEIITTLGDDMGGRLEYRPDGRLDIAAMNARLKRMASQPISDLREALLDESPVLQEPEEPAATVVEPVKEVVKVPKESGLVALKKSRENITTLNPNSLLPKFFNKIGEPIFGMHHYLDIFEIANISLSSSNHPNYKLMFETANLSRERFIQDLLGIFSVVLDSNPELVAELQIVYPSYTEVKSTNGLTWAFSFLNGKLKVLINHFLDGERNPFYSNVLNFIRRPDMTRQERAFIFVTYVLKKVLPEGTPFFDLYKGKRFEYLNSNILRHIPDEILLKIDGDLDDKEQVWIGLTDLIKWHCAGGGDLLNRDTLFDLEKIKPFDADNPKESLEKFIQDYASGWVNLISRTDLSVEVRLKKLVEMLVDFSERFVIIKKSEIVSYLGTDRAAKVRQEGSTPLRKRNRGRLWAMLVGALTTLGITTVLGGGPLSSGQNMVKKDKETVKVETDINSTLSQIKNDGEFILRIRSLSGSEVVNLNTEILERVWSYKAFADSSNASGNRLVYDLFGGAGSVNGRKGLSQDQIIAVCRKLHNILPVVEKVKLEQALREKMNIKL